MSLNIKLNADWTVGRLLKQKDMCKSNTRGNNLRINHDCQKGGKILITDKGIRRNLDCPTKGPYMVVQA